MAKIRRYSAMPLSVLISTAFVCSITTPSPGATVTEAVPVTITGTVAPGAVIVQVKLGSTLLGTASIVGTTWSFSWTPQTADVGARTINATATAANAQQVSAPGVDVTVAAALSGPLAIMAGAIRAGFSGDIGLTTNAGTVTWVDQAPVPHNITGTGTILATAQNNMPGLQTVAASNHALNSTFAIPAPGTSPSYLWAIQRDDLHSTFANVVCMGTAGNIMTVLKDNGTGDACLFDNSLFGVRHAGGLTLSAFKRIRALFTGTGTDLLQIGVGTAVTGAAAGNTAGTGIYLGVSNSTASSNTHLELWLFSRAPTSPELATLDAWGNAKWAGTFA